MAKIIIIQRILTAYRKDIFDELKKYSDFIILHSENNSGIRQVTSSYSKKIKSFKYYSKDNTVFLNVFGYIIREKPEIVIHEFTMGIISLFPTFLVAKLLGSKFVLWGHGYNRRKGFSPENSILDKIRLFLMRKSDAIILYGQEGKKQLAGYLKSEKMFVAYNSLNTRRLTAIRDKFEKEGKIAIKNRIGFRFKYNIIFIGRILKYKQPDLLIEMFYSYLFEKYNDTLGIHFVGEGDYLINLKKRVQKLGLERNIIFHGAIYDDLKVGELLYCSDLMIMPGLLGLSINHAFNFNCPVVTFEQTGHGPEIEYLVHKVTGFIIREHSLREMASTIDYYLQNKTMQVSMKKNIRYMVDNVCSLDNFIKGFQDTIKYVSRNG